MKQLILTLAIGFALQATTSYAQFNPHPEGIDYTENFRGQFHFSPKSEWMNDVNALMYHDGKYHMIYQWGKKIRHGGYATTTDLLHWTDEGVALVPQKTFLPKEAINVSGDQVYSGCGVVVSGPTAEKITGSPIEAMVAIYTGTACGTCLAWSNDGGKKWHDYKANPVANPTGGANPRDPHVFWHDPTKKWVLAIYEGGTTFYGSEDLIEWEKLSNIRFGYECPDIYEIPLDGDRSKMKWILQDAKGSYLVGQFDGTAFIVEQDKLLMDVGPDFYAAQTFFRPTMPDRRLTQIAWNDLWNGGVGEQGWERHATFPVDLGLVTYEGKMRITRTPIPEIENLYTGTKTVGPKTLAQGENLLKGIQSKTFDLTVAFDLKDTKATEIVFQIANITLRYDIENQQFIGMNVIKRSTPRVGPPKELKPGADGTLKIRMLVDWSQLEVFSAGGVFSYSANLPLTPDDSSLAITAGGGDVKVVGLTLSEVARIWPKPKQ